MPRQLLQERNWVVGLIAGLEDNRVSADMRNDFLKRGLYRTKTAADIWDTPEFNIGFKYGIIAALACLFNVQGQDVEQVRPADYS